MKIYKYTLQLADIQEVEISGLRKMLSASNQGNSVVLYALVDEFSNTVYKNEIVIIGTGNPIQIDIFEYEFIGTVNLYGGTLMFHVFYKTKKQ